MIKCHFDRPLVHAQLKVSQTNKQTQQKTTFYSLSNLKELVLDRTQQKKKMNAFKQKFSTIFNCFMPNLFNKNCDWKVIKH